MLQNIRDNSQGLVAKLIIGAIIVVFAFFGVDTIVGTLINNVAVITVNGVEIDEYELTVETQRRAQERLLAMGVDADSSAIDEALLRQEALADLIQQELLFQAASKSGMAISSMSVDRRIAQNQDFQVDGIFNNNRAQLLLNNLGYTPSTYREALTREGLLNQLLVVYTGSGFITNVELNRLAEITNQRRSLRYLLLNLESQAAGIEISESEIEEYYQSNQQEFMQEELVAIEYLELDKNDIFPGVEITDEQIQAQYDLELSVYQSQIERRASHILLEVNDDSTRDNALNLARELKIRIDNGESFADLALEFSDDPGSAEDGGDVGYTTGVSFVEDFELALQSLEIDEVSDPVITEFGVHLIKLTERSTSELETLEDSRDRILRDLRGSEVDNIYLARAEELNNLSFESIDLQDPAEIMDLRIQTTEPFGRSGGVGIAASPTVISQAFSSFVLKDGLNSDLINLDDSRSAVIRVIEHSLPIVQDLIAVQAEINILLKSERVREQVQSIGETITGNLQIGQDIEELIIEQDLSWSELKDVRRSNTELSPELIDMIFSMAKPASESDTSIEGFQLSTGQYVVVELQQIEVGSVDDFEGNERENMKTFIAQLTASDDFNSFLNSIRSSADIEQ